MKGFMTKEEKYPKLILMRHGASLWNDLNVFTGWVDVPLSEKGMQESIEGGEKIQEIPIDVIFTSTLIRAHMTLFLAMLKHKSAKVPIIQHEGEDKQAKWSQIFSKEAKENSIPVYCSWHLNERMYGELQGTNKAEMAEKYGKEQIHIWRRSYDEAPPQGESLAMTAQRTLPYFTEKILPFIQEKKNVFIAAHGNSLRSIVMHLENLSKEEVVKLEIPTGQPLMYYYHNEEWVKAEL